MSEGFQVTNTSNPVVIGSVNLQKVLEIAYCTSIVSWSRPRFQHTQVIFLLSLILNLTFIISRTTRSPIVVYEEHTFFSSTHIKKQKSIAKWIRQDLEQLHLKRWGFVLKQSSVNHIFSLYTGLSSFHNPRRINPGHLEPLRVNHSLKFVQLLYTCTKLNLIFLSGIVFEFCIILIMNIFDGLVFYIKNYSF